MVYLFLLELLIHRLGDPKCVVSEISGCSDMYVVIRYFTVSVRRTGTFLVYIYIYIYIYIYMYIKFEHVACERQISNDNIIIQHRGSNKLSSSVPFSCHPVLGWRRRTREWRR